MHLQRGARGVRGRGGRTGSAAAAGSATTAPRPAPPPATNHADEEAILWTPCLLPLISLKGSSSNEANAGAFFFCRMSEKVNQKVYEMKISTVPHKFTLFRGTHHGMFIR